MAKTKKTIKNKEDGIDELKKRLSDSKEELFKIILDHSQFKLKNTRSIFNTRKEIARIKTIIREKELAIKGEDKWKF